MPDTIYRERFGQDSETVSRSMADIDLAAKRHATVRDGQGGPAWGDEDAADHAGKQVKGGTLQMPVGARQGLDTTCTQQYCRTRRASLN